MTTLGVIAWLIGHGMRQLAVKSPSFAQCLYDAIRLHGWSNMCQVERCARVNHALSVQGISTLNMCLWMPVGNKAVEHIGTAYNLISDRQPLLTSSPGSEMPLKWHYCVLTRPSSASLRALLKSSWLWPKMCARSASGAWSSRGHTVTPSFDSYCLIPLTLLSWLSSICHSIRSGRS